MKSPFFITSIFVVAGLLLPGCKHGESAEDLQKDTVFNDPEGGEIEELRGGAFFIGNGTYSPVDIFLTRDEIGIIHGIPVDSGMVTMHSLQTGEERLQFGQRGEDPWQWTMPPVYLESGEHHADNELSLFSFVRLEVYEFDPGQPESAFSSLKEDRARPLPGELMGSQKAMRMANGHYACTLPGDQRGKLAVWDPTTGSVRYAPYLPEVGKKLPQEFFTAFYNGPVAVKPDRSRLVMHSNYFNQFEIYDPNGRLLRIVRFGRDAAPAFMSSEPTPPTLKLHYLDFAVTNERIYAVWAGMSASEFEAFFDEGRLDRLNTELHVYSWEGTLTDRYQLNYPVKEIAVTGSGDRIFGINFLSEEEPIVVFDL